jgi:hypothetical protein
MSLIEQPGEYQITWDLGKDVTYEILIANLGGYEAAKKIAENTPPKEIHQTEFFDEHGNYYANDCGDLVVWGGYGWLGVEGNCPTLHCIDYLIYILLQYRRQHKIYEAGDLVVMADADDYNIIFKVIGKPMRLYHLQGNDDLFYGRLDFQIRHATDEEIEAGKRLEGNS